MADGESPADAAGRVALERVFTCFDDGRSFRLEAGAGAGKTYSLEKALRRSEEHTSELQSLMRISYAVFCLKKKKIKKTYIIYTLITLYTNIHDETKTTTH